MKIHEMVFSPTGGTQKVCDIISGEFQGEKGKIDLLKIDGLTENDKITAEDICIIAVPSFGGRVPVPAATNIQKIEGNHAKTILVAVYGNRAYDDTLLELKEIAEKSGFSCVAAIAAVAEHSIMHQFGTGRPDEKDQVELKKYAQQIANEISNKSEFGKLCVPGDYPYREFGGLPLHVKVGKSCNGCGVCVNRCPMGAIQRGNPKATDYQKCIACMACVSVCPQKARKLNRFVLAIAANKMKKSCSTRKENELIMGVQ